MLGRMGSGLTPPKHGLRSEWISCTRMRPPASRRADPAGTGAPHRLDEDAHVGGPADASRSTVRADVDARSPRTGRSARPCRPPRRRRTAGARRRTAVRGSSPRATARMSGPAAAPVGDLTLKPLSVHGLWEAVIMMPAAAPRSTTSKEVIWVGHGVARDRRPGCRGPAAPRGRGARSTRERSAGRRR